MIEKWHRDRSWFGKVHGNRRGFEKQKSDRSMLELLQQNRGVIEKQQKDREACLGHCSGIGV